jgi:hypothetical protein
MTGHCKTGEVMRVLRVEGAEECAAAVGRQSIAALGTGAVLR